MRLDREKRYHLYHTTISLALLWALTLTINRYYQLKVPFLIATALSFLLPWMFLLFDLYKKSTITYLAAGSLLFVAAIALRLKQMNPVQWIKELAEWCFLYDGSKERYMAAYAYFILAVACVAGAALLYLLTKKQLLRAILAVVTLSALITLSVSKIEADKAAVAGSIFYLTAVLVEIAGRRYQGRAGRMEREEANLYLLPVCLLVSFLAVCLPSQAEPIQWKGVKYIYTTVRDQITVWRTELEYFLGNGSDEFFLTFSGYSGDDGTLEKKGGVIQNSGIALHITASSTERPIYLIGSARDIYTGERWEKGDQNDSTDMEEYRMDYYEMIYALSRQDINELESNSYLHRVTVYTEYNNVVTKTFFYPLKMACLEFRSKYKKIDAMTSNIKFAKTRSKGTKYNTSFFEMNLQGEAFQEMLRRADRFDYEELLDSNEKSLQWLKLHLFGNDDATFFNAKQAVIGQLRKRAGVINTKYTSLPESLPERVYQLAQEITQGHSSSYDKLKAIEKYLWSYTYTLQPEAVPGSADFVDHFLFESREGYCTSYATAMAVLGRCIGIPTRYVEGFIVDFKEKEENGKYQVRNHKAHAWAEAYIEGVGWIPFEATPAFLDIRYTTWKDQAREGVGNRGIAGISTFEEYTRLQPETRSDQDTVQSKKETRDFRWGDTILLAVPGLITLILMLLLYFWIMKLRYWYKFNKEDNSGKMIRLFLRILALLEKEGFSLNRQETILMLSSRIKDRYCFNRVTFGMVANIFMQYRYAEKEVTESELNQILEFYRGLSRKQKEEYNIAKFWMEEFIFLMKNK